MIPFGQVGTVTEFNRAQQRGQAEFPDGGVLRFKVNELRHSPRAGGASGATVSDIHDEPGFGAGSQLLCVRADAFQIQ